jgi:transposase-like protein
MPKQYGREFRRSICERLVAGEAVSTVSNQSGVSVATLYLWKRQALIDAGLKPGTRSVEVDELALSFPRSSGQLLLVADHAACAAS